MSWWRTINFRCRFRFVMSKEKWSFATKAGRQEILKRRFGGNGLDAIQIFLGFAAPGAEAGTLESVYVSA
jgi:hypothetical protein